MKVLWLDAREVLQLHLDALAQFGGLDGGVDMGLLESTLAKPQQVQNYVEDASLTVLAASYGFGFAKNHCFKDGNKRIALLTAAIFLEINGQSLIADEAETAKVFEGLAIGEISEEQLAQWIAENVEPN